MSSALENRRDIARRIDGLMGGRPEVTAVYVLGSVASDQADERSDVDISFVYNHAPPPLSTRRELLSRIGSGWQPDTPNSDDPMWAGNAMPDVGDIGVVEGVRVEVIYQASQLISEVLGEVLDRGAITTPKMPDRPYTLAGLVQRAWVLRDKDGLLRGWIGRTQTYPALLKRNVLRHFIPVLRENAEALTDSAERGYGANTYLFFLTRATDSMDSVLYALNETYDPADKRAQLSVLPP